MTGLGYAGRDASVTAINIPIVASSLSLTTGGQNGGYYNNLTGTGFP